MAEKTQKIQPYKTEGIQKIKELIESSQNVIFTDFRGLNVTQITELRRTLQEKESEYRVVKNNYARLALRELGFPFEEDFLIDPTALALVKSDIGPISKVLFEFTKDSTLRIKGGLVEHIRSIHPSGLCHKDLHFALGQFCDKAGKFELLLNGFNPCFTPVPQSRAYGQYGNYRDNNNYFSIIAGPAREIRNPLGQFVGF